MTSDLPSWESVFNFAAYPSFAFLFDGAPSDRSKHTYLSLLNLGLTDEKASGTLAAVRAASGASADVDAEIAALLDGIHWRPHLVGATVLAWGGGTAQVVPRLWDTFDRGSMVSPQLAVAASLRDPEFERIARRHIERWSTRANWNTPGFDHGDPKELSALLYLCGLLPSCDNWLDGLSPSATIKAALARDLMYDRGGRTAMNWLERIQALRGVQREV